MGRRGWHVGVIGIVASRLQKLYGRPVIVVGFDDQGDGKGSGRSVEGCRIIDGLRAAAALLDRYGGHEMAAGLSIREERLAEFRAAFQAWMDEAVPDAALQPRLRLDGELEVGAVDDALYRDLGRLAPLRPGESPARLRLPRRGAQPRPADDQAEAREALPRLRQWER